MKFSALLSIYRKESPAFFIRAMESIWDFQTVKPSEIILVKDGPLPDRLDLVVLEWQERLGNALRVVSLHENIGLGAALNEGLRHCTHDLVARMDTDDIASPGRFEMQLRYLALHPEVDIVGGWITEFQDAEDQIYNYRRLPLNHADLVLYAKTRCPLNHMTVMFRRSKVLEVGGYPDLRVGQDYPLWIRIIQAGGKIANLPEYLVNMRAGQDMARRRRNFGRIRNEIGLQYSMYKDGFISLPRLIFNSTGRTVFRLIPGQLALQIYKRAWRG